MEEIGFVREQSLVPTRCFALPKITAYDGLWTGANGQPKGHLNLATESVSFYPLGRKEHK